MDFFWEVHPHTLGDNNYLFKMKNKRIKNSFINLCKFLLYNK